MKYILRAVYGVAGAFGFVWLAGFLLPLEHEASAAIRLQATPEAVWEVLAAVENYPNWKSGVATSDVIRPRPHLIWRETDHRGQAMVYNQGAGRPAEKWVEHLSGGDFELGCVRIYLIAGDDGGSRVSLTEKAKIKNPLARFRARFVTGYAANLRGLLGDMKKRLGE